MGQNTTTLIAAAHSHLAHGTLVDDTTVRALATLVDKAPNTRDALIMCALTADGMTATDTVDAAMHPDTPDTQRRLDALTGASYHGTPHLAVNTTRYTRLMALAGRMRGLCPEHGNVCTAIAIYLAWFVDDMAALREQVELLDVTRPLPPLAVIAVGAAQSGVHSHAALG